MTDDECKKRLAAFQKPVLAKDEEDLDDPWTLEEKIKSAHRIMRRLGIEGDLCDPFERKDDDVRT